MIKELTLRRFKRFEEETFDLSNHVILAGPNNCGKTTVLQAVTAWALALKRWRMLNDYQRHGGAYPKAPLSRQAFSAVPLRSFDLLWKDRDYRGIAEIEVLLDDSRRVTMEFHKDSTEQIYVRPKNIVLPEVVRDMELDVVYAATVGGLSVEEPVYMPDYIETLLGRQRPGDVVRNLLLQASRGGAWSQLAAAVQRLFGIEILVPQTPGGQIICEYRQRDGGPSFDIMSAGSGLQQVLLLLACLYTRSGSIVLVDEPDAHLHVFLQDTIFAELNRAAAETRSQLILATHSEVIFNSAAPQQICLMLGRPRRLSSVTEVRRLEKAVGVLQQSDLIMALETPGILYLDGYTDLNLLREWARILDHPLRHYLNHSPFWRPKQHSGRSDAREIPATEHFEALQLVSGGITGIWLLDADGRDRIQVSDTPERGKLNRVRWTRYEIESYLVCPAVLARFINKQTGSGGAEAVKRFLSREYDRYAGAALGSSIAEAFIADPTRPSEIVERYLADKKARTTIVGGILQEGGVHGLEYGRFSEIAAMMLPEEIHPEVREKLDFIQQAFGL